MSGIKDAFSAVKLGWVASAILRIISTISISWQSWQRPPPSRSAPLTGRGGGPNSHAPAGTRV